MVPCIGLQFTSHLLLTSIVLINVRKLPVNIGWFTKIALSLSTLGKIFITQHFEIFFIFFPGTRIVT